MGREKQVKECVNGCFDDYTDCFDVDIEEEDYSQGEWAYFNVIIKHETLGSEYEINVRANSETIEMDYYEDSWYALSKENLFCYMWFKEAKERQ